MNANKGLEGVVAAETRLSMVDGQAGELVIAGFRVAELAMNATFEETILLLWDGELPDAATLRRFRDDLAKRRELAPETLELLRAAAPRKVEPMDALRMAVGTLPSRGDAEDARNVIAVSPTIVAAYWRLLHGEEPIAPRGDLSHAANYLSMLTGSEPSDESTRGLETYLNTVVDHGLNASTRPSPLA